MIITILVIIRATIEINQKVFRFKMIISRAISGRDDKIQNLNKISKLNRYDCVLKPVRYAVEVAI